MSEGGRGRNAQERLPGSSGPRRPIFKKYFVVLFSAVVIPLAIASASDAWFGYRDQSVLISNMLGVEARAAAGEIKGFLDGIVDQLGWTVQLPWSVDFH